MGAGAVSGCCLGRCLGAGDGAGAFCEIDGLVLGGQLTVRAHSARLTVLGARGAGAGAVLGCCLGCYLRCWSWCGRILGVLFGVLVRANGFGWPGDGRGRVFARLMAGC